ncbi:MAG: ATP-binding protein [Planctomycetes bacterium]|nr:ATP-binding protein [Planctomycetota bacterium]
MAIKIKSLKESLEDNGVKVLVYGTSGVGKTVLCATTNEKTLIISAEAGLLSIRDAPGDISVASVETFADVKGLYEDLRDYEHPFKWICLDSITEIAEVCLAAEKKSAKDPRQAYGLMADEMFDLLRKFRDLPRVNILMTAKQIRLADERGVTAYAPWMPGKQLTSGLSYLFDEVFVMRIFTDEDGENVRSLQTERDSQYEAKDRSGALDQYEDPSIKKIYEKIHKKPDAVESSKEAEEVEGAEVKAPAKKSSPKKAARKSKK